MRWTLVAWILSFVLVANASGGVAGSGVLSSATASPGYEIVELVRGAELHGANGTFVGPDGHLYVASVMGGEIVVFDVDRGEIVRRHGPSDGVLHPDDVTFGPDGSMYWTDILIGEVGRRAPDGTVTKQFVAPGVNPITFSPDGRLFVGLCFFGDGLLELDPELRAPPRTIVVASDENPFPLGFFNAFSFGPDGRLYGPLYGGDSFIGFDVDSCENTSQPWVDCDIRVLASGFHTPVAAKLSPQGVLHALDSWTGELVTLDLVTGARTLVAQLGQGLDNLAFTPDGRLFVTNADDGSVVELLAGGAVRTLSPGGLIVPSGVAVLERPDGEASVLVGDHFRLWEFDARTGAVIGFTKGSLVGVGMAPPNTVSADGDLLVTTSVQLLVAQVVDPWTGEFIEHHVFGFPYDALRIGADLAVVDLMAGGVVWARTRDLILAIDEQQVFLPVGLATDGERLWVSDWATGIVWQVAFEGTSALPPVPVAFDLAMPEGLALDHDGGLLVVEAGAGRLSRIDLATGAVEVIASGLATGREAIASVPPPFFLSSVTVDAAGAIYVTGDVENVVYHISRKQAGDTGPLRRDLAVGAALNGANGMYFGPDGNLYVAVFASGEVVALDPQSGEIVARFGRDDGVLAPDDVVFGPDGSMYWTDIIVGEVGRRAPDGTVTKQFVAPGVNPITFNDEGRLFVALDFAGDGLYEIDPELMKPPRPIVVATEAAPFPLGFLNGFDFGPDGRLYGPLFAVGIVISIDVDSCDATSDPWNDCDLRVVAADFGVPAAVKFDPSGRLHVVDQTGEVFRIDLESGEKTRIATLQEGLDNLAFDDQGNLFVSSADFGWVAQIEDDGRARYLTRGGMILPQGLAVLPGPHGRDRVFVADLFRLYEVDGPSGQDLAVFKGHLLADPGRLTPPMTLSADGERLVVSSLFGAAVQVWDPLTEAVLEHYDFPAPANAIRFQGEVIVADLALGGVVWASDMTVFLASDFESVFVPAGLATDGERLWVGDWVTGIVWQLEFAGRDVVATVPVAFDLAQPEGMALDLDGSLLVVEAGTRQLSRIDLATGAVSVVATGLDVGMPGLEGFPPTWWFDGVAVGPSGAIYVSENGRNVLTRIVRR